ncbi:MULTISPECIES: YifB family Mg chelatase-like AAA ATPase [unclassified Bacillus (in: firmicutes)]|uniref:YifB family Mg chelatase-like AAA ATPase n=1 Tax=unclassified Bacillus (in: firmicutes) TaxID=185979 RepID=UPI0008EB646B|nr:MULTISPECIES: YifB family Mg chelatase-like AAA ATPase [unclassified Bacillus (in: firmicutes)]SFB19556.1 magnesium chelatase family protein [Bacillus sp. UNCCL13]SFQ90691.1 magnesium chelatase family protein [Bacillus sp. cl95]
MYSKVNSIGLKGMEGYRLVVEAQVLPGPDLFVIVGLPDASVKESRERVVAALHTIGYNTISQKIIINLSPSEQKKNGPMFDLPIAISILLSLGEIKSRISDKVGFIGALSLDGSIKPVEGMLPAVIAAKKMGMDRLYLPYDDHLPALEFEEMEVVYVSTIKDVIQHLSGQEILSFIQKREEQEVPLQHTDFQQIVGHSYAKGALEIAAAGEHHLFMSGPPGCGKSLLAESFPSILPHLSKEAQLEMISIYQLSSSSHLHSKLPPYRNPHHSASGVSIIGGGTYPKPGEISLAHRGVLFLDEIAEFSKKTLDMLRQPLEKGEVTISRTNASVTYPASFILIGAMNPCPCGYAGSNNHYCTCSPNQINSYQNKLSGPLRDRFDISLFLTPIDLKGGITNEESSHIIRRRVENARERQYERYEREICNGRVSGQLLLKKCGLGEGQKRMLQQLSVKKNWSNRTQLKIIRLSRTICDLVDSPSITEESIWSAIQLNKSTVTKEKHFRPHVR